MKIILPQIQKYKFLKKTAKIWKKKNRNWNRNCNWNCNRQCWKTHCVTGVLGLFWTLTNCKNFQHKEHKRKKHKNKKKDEIPNGITDAITHVIFWFVAIGNNIIIAIRCRVGIVTFILVICVIGWSCTPLRFNEFLHRRTIRTAILAACWCRVNFIFDIGCAKCFATIDTTPASCSLSWIL